MVMAMAHQLVEETFSSLSSSSSTTTEVGGYLNIKDEWMPIILSTIAGLSTCIGALVVFLYPKGTEISSKMMSYSLALAGSVMVTVSVISIGPECVFHKEGLEEGEGEGESKKFISMYEFVWRFFYFSLGCALYFFLRLFFPEPDEILFHSTNNNNNNNDVNNNDLNEDDVESLSDSPNKNNNNNNNNKLNKRHHLSSQVAQAQAQSQTHTKIMSSPLLARSNSYENTDNNNNSNNNRKKKYSITTSHHSSNNILLCSGNDLKDPSRKRAWRVALLLFISLLLHNFPEGLAVAASTISSMKLGFTVCIGIMIHNIPEGIAIAVPCLKARPDQPWLAFVLASVSGLAEPLGAWVAMTLIAWKQKQEQEQQGIGGGITSTGASAIDESFLGNILSFVAGIMITVAVYELFPEGKTHVKMILKEENNNNNNNKNNNNTNTTTTNTSSNELSGNNGIGVHQDQESTTTSTSFSSAGAVVLCFIKDLLDSKSASFSYNWGLVSGFILMLLTELYLDA